MLLAEGKDRTVDGWIISPKMPDAKPLSGMRQRKGGFGIAGMRKPREDGKSFSVWKKLAKYVVSLCRLWCDEADRKNIVPRYAKRALGASVTSLNQQADVWCLTVPDAECFSLANGAIVHNCADALRYVAVAMQEARRATWRDDAEAPPRLIQRGSRGANLTWMSR